jgi:RNA polymerase sigma factor (sigma-70 family)
MSAFRGKVSSSLRTVVSHADRLNDFLGRLESDEARRQASVVGVFVGAVIADVCEGRVADEARAAIVGYLDEVHRRIARELRCGTRLECCRADDGTATPACMSVALSVGLAAATARAPAEQGRCDGPATLARFHAEMALVEEQALAFARWIPASSATLDDLRSFGGEGLLDAARRFDPGRGVPFEYWAQLQIRSAILDGVRRADMRSGNSTAIALIQATPSPMQTPEDLVAIAERRARRQSEIAALLVRLPSAERQLLELHYFAEQSLAQVANAMGVHRVTANRLHHRALESLRRELRADTV